MLILKSWLRVGTASNGGETSHGSVERHEAQTPTFKSNEEIRQRAEVEMGTRRERGRFKASMRAYASKRIKTPSSKRGERAMPAERKRSLSISALRLGQAPS